MSFVEDVFCRKRPPGPESPEATSALVREHPCPWNLDIDHAAYAKHPDTPLQWLLQLAERYPDRILQNESFRLHLALSPERFRNASMLCKLQLLEQWDIDPELIRLLAASKSADDTLRVAAAMNPRCPGDLLWAYLEHNKHVRRAIRQNPRAPRDLLREVDRRESYQSGLRRRYKQAHAAPAVPCSVRRVEAEFGIDALLPECPFTPAAPVSWSERWRRRSIRRLRRSA